MQQTTDELKAKYDAIKPQVQKPTPTTFDIKTNLQN
jgi:hypothetical protein